MCALYYCRFENLTFFLSDIRSQFPLVIRLTRCRFSRLHFFSLLEATKKIVDRPLQRYYSRINDHSTYVWKFSDTRLNINPTVITKLRLAAASYSPTKFYKLPNQFYRVSSSSTYLFISPSYLVALPLTYLSGCTRSLLDSKSHPLHVYARGRHFGVMTSSVVAIMPKEQ